MFNALLLMIVATMSHTMVIGNSDTFVSPVEIADTCYLYIKNLQEIEDVLDFVEELFKDLPIEDLRNWFKREILPIGYILRIPVIKGQESRYGPLLQRYGTAPSKIEEKEVTESAPLVFPLKVGNAPPSVKDTLPTVPSVDITPVPARKKLEDPITSNGVDHQDPNTKMPEWYSRNPFYVNLRYSIVHTYQLFPRVAHLLGYMDTRDCLHNSPTITDFGDTWTLWDFANALKAAEDEHPDVMNNKTLITTDDDQNQE